jgi:hypothetical protein
MKVKTNYFEVHGIFLTPPWSTIELQLNFNQASRGGVSYVQLLWLITKNSDG